MSAHATFFGSTTPAHGAAMSAVFPDSPAGAPGTLDVLDPAQSAPGACPFEVRFGRRLPRGFAELAAGLSWRELVETFAPSTRSLHLSDFRSAPLGRGRHTYQATLSAPGDDTTPRRLTVTASGDAAAMSEMLAVLGTAVEMRRLHQFSAGSTWCTIMQATDDRRTAWAMGFGETSAEANVRGLISAASRLYFH